MWWSKTYDIFHRNAAEWTFKVAEKWKKKYLKIALKVCTSGTAIGYIPSLHNTDFSVLSEGLNSAFSFLMHILTILQS